MPEISDISDIERVKSDILPDIKRHRSDIFEIVGRKCT